MLIKVTIKVINKISFFDRVLTEAEDPIAAPGNHTKKYLWDLRDWPEVAVIVNEELQVMGFKVDYYITYPDGSINWSDMYGKEPLPNFKCLILPDHDTGDTISVIINFIGLNSMQVRQSLPSDIKGRDTEFVGLEQYVKGG